MDRQPLYVEWPDSSLRRLREAGAVDGKFSGKEIMVGSLYGSVYFIDYETAQPRARQFLSAIR